jgi:antirestriction protein ArdC
MNNFFINTVIAQAIELGFDFEILGKELTIEDINTELEEFFYSVLFHELGHSTGHKSRLARKDFCEASFGSETYSKEELVAEMTAAFLCGVNQIELKTIDNSAAYIKSWLKKLKDDPKMVVLAAAQAQKAADYILNKN